MLFVVDVTEKSKWSVFENIPQNKDVNYIPRDESIVNKLYQGVLKSINDLFWF